MHIVYTCMHSATNFFHVQIIFILAHNFISLLQVNLDSDTRMETVVGLESPSRETFDVAQHKIQALMAKDSYPRFLESDLYQYILGNVSKV